MAKPPKNPKVLEQIAELPDAMKAALADRKPGTPVTLETLLAGNEWEGTRRELRDKGMSLVRTNDGQDRFLAVNFAPDGSVMDMAAAIPRNSGRALDFVQQIADFQDALSEDQTERAEAVALFHKIARADGTTNNAINKMAALIAPAGKFKVKGVRGQRGKAGDKVSVEFETLLNWWKDNVNSRGDEGVITGDRGLSAFIMQGARLLFIEGDHIARHPFTNVTVPPLGGRKFSLPMNLQTYSAQHIEIPSGLESTNMEIMYWAPPQEFVRLLDQTEDKNLKKYLERLIPAKVRKELKDTGQYFLDPALMIHIRHRATQVDAFGTSLIEPTLPEIRYKRALDALELTVLTNIMARAVIIKVGSDNENSVYHKSEVTASRLSLLQRMMRQVGPSATILWGGPDINVVEVSAHSALLDIVPRMQMAERRHLMALGMPAVLMIGEGTDGKASGIASALGVAAELAEVQDQYAKAMIGLAEKIGTENNFKDVEVVWEWTNNLLEDKQAAAELILKMYDRGLLTPETALEETGFDFDAEQIRQADAVKEGHKAEIFGPPKASPNNPSGQGSERNGGGGEGRPTKKQSADPDPRSGKETRSPVENK